jgi:hypothetical protein
MVLVFGGEARFILCHDEHVSTRRYRYGQTGYGNSDINVLEYPQEVVVPLKSKIVVQIACGAYHR